MLERFSQDVADVSDGDTPDPVAEAAKDWGKTIAGVLSAGGVVTLLLGEQKLGDLSEGWQVLVIWMFAGALAAAVTAILVAFNVAWEPRKIHNSGKSGKLTVSISLTIIALVILACTAFPLMNGKASSPKQYLAEFASGDIECGVLAKNPSLSINGRALTGVEDIQEVAACP